jgi:hypothetical protein
MAGGSGLQEIVWLNPSMPAYSGSRAMQLWRNYLNKSPPMPRAINLKERLGPLIA